MRPSLGSLKAYRDFPWLWAVHPKCGWEVHVDICTVNDLEFLSRPMTGASGCVLWAKYSLLDTQGMRKIEIDPRENLGMNILKGFRSELFSVIEISHLVLDTGSHVKTVLHVMRVSKKLNIVSECLKLSRQA